MVICPHCRGVGRICQPAHSAVCTTHDGPCICGAGDDPVPVSCRTCNDEGVVNQLTADVYRARGGPRPSPPLRGFA